MPYTSFNGALPNGAAPDNQNGTAVLQSIRDNAYAMRDAIVAAGSFPGWNKTPSGGTEAQPAQMLASKGVERIKVLITYGTDGGEAGSVTQAVYSYSSDSGAVYSTIGTRTIAYTANGYFNGDTWS